MPPQDSNLSPNVQWSLHSNSWIKGVYSMELIKQAQLVYQRAQGIQQLTEENLKWKRTVLNGVRFEPDAIGDEEKLGAILLLGESPEIPGQPASTAQRNKFKRLFNQEFRLVRQQVTATIRLCTNGHHLIACSRQYLYNFSLNTSEAQFAAETTHSMFAEFTEIFDAILQVWASAQTSYDETSQYLTHSAVSAEELLALMRSSSNLLEEITRLQARAANLHSSLLAKVS